MTTTIEIHRKAEAERAAVARHEEIRKIAPLLLAGLMSKPLLVTNETAATDAINAAASLVDQLNLIRPE